LNEFKEMMGAIRAHYRGVTDVMTLYHKENMKRFASLDRRMVKLIGRMDRLNSGLKRLAKVVRQIVNLGH
jgi:hypothetical protein